MLRLRIRKVHGGIGGDARHKPFEHIYRYRYRRYRITEGSETRQRHKAAGHLFGYTGPERSAGE